MPARAAAPREQRRRHRLERVHRRRAIDEDETHPARAPFRVAVHRHQARPRLEHGVGSGAVGVRPARAVAGNRDVEQTLVPGAHTVVVEAQPRHAAGPGALDRDVGAVDQAQRRRPSARMLEVQRHAALAAVHRQRHRRMIAMPGAEAAQPVARRRLDLDHFGAVRGQQVAAARPRHALAHVDDANPREGAVVGGFGHDDSGTRLASVLRLKLASLSIAIADSGRINDTRIPSPSNGPKPPAISSHPSNASVTASNGQYEANIRARTGIGFAL